ncbi:antitoxin Xre-like helix-turn-helix domain-containing protein [Pseudorhodoferax sp. Leaf274]|uniref:type II RES/Xre toxin-antitoxin system antitoxin n=1 Tax=Pseudorhodoferax sp. Leaf274 TaxID=1736318 RepID=UPI000B074DEF|nr:antitoxin Xre-like helix-turn-helix domain-containing protein [Pseudorhodoferax sp. Leaf274]
MTAKMQPRATRKHSVPRAKPSGKTRLPPHAAAVPRQDTDIYSFIDVFRAEPLARVRMIKAGLPADYLDQLARRMKMPKERLLPTLGIAPATVSRKVRQALPLSSDDSERALGMARLVGQVQAMVEESGDPEGFDAAQWLAQWMEEPLPSLGGARPSELMDTSEGQAMVSNALARMQSGAYA